MVYEHPVYTPESVAAQHRLPELTTAVTAFAGAYHGWGFHEDGCRSGVARGSRAGGAMVTRGVAPPPSAAARTARVQATAQPTA